MVGLGNLIIETGTGTGTGNLTLTAYPYFRRFSDAFSTGAGNTFYYCIRHRAANEFEVGIGYLNDANTLVRFLIIESSNANSAVNFASGDKDVICDIPGSLQVSLGNANTFSKTQLIDDGIGNTAVLGNTSGGSGGNFTGTSIAITASTSDNAYSASIASNSDFAAGYFSDNNNFKAVSLGTSLYAVDGIGAINTDTGFYVNGVAIDTSGVSIAQARTLTFLGI